MSETDKISIRNLKIEKRIADISKWKIPEQDKKDVKEGFVRALRLGELTGKVVKDGGLSVYLSDIKVALEFIGKSVTKITEEDIRKFHEAMINDSLTYTQLRNEIKIVKGEDVETKIKTKNAYSKNKKVSIRRSFILFLKWKLDEKAFKFIKLLKIKLGGKEKDIDAPSEAEVEKLYFGCKKNYERFLIAVLFDAGCRAEEFHNVRMDDVIFPKTGESFIKLRFRSEYSKTKGRSISLYWKYSTKAVTDFYNERLKEGAKATDPVFNRTYHLSRKFLNRLSRRVLGKGMHYHAMRHASATHYVYVIKNDHQMCYRYGWNFGSPMIQRYARKRDFSEEVDKEIEHTEMSSLKAEIDKLKLNSDMKDKELEKRNKEFADALESHNKDMKQVRELLKVLKSNKD